MFVEKLLVDANAFIKALPLETFSSQVITIPDVIKEIRDSSTKQRLKFTPYDLKLQEPSSEAIKRATEYAKLTGDYASLSLVDIKLIALGIQAHEAYFPVEYKNSKTKIVFGNGNTPQQRLTSEKVNAEIIASENNLPEGFYFPKNDILKHNLYFKNHSYAEGYNFSSKDVKLFRKLEGIQIEEEFVHLQRWYKHISALLQMNEYFKLNEDMEKLEDEYSQDDDYSDVSDAEDSGVSDEVESEEDSDGGGWITPSNYKPKKVEGILNGSSSSSPVGILSSDFAIQNVVLHTNMNLISLDGTKINSLRSYILRCYSCFEKTSQFDKKFCPRCGNKTLRKVSVSIQEDGTMKLHFSKRFVTSSRGTKYSLPTPEGGKHAVNPILCEDQPVPQQRRSKKSIARESGPFSMNDINSRSFFATRTNTHYWNYKNPNEIKGKGRKKK